MVLELKFKVVATSDASYVAGFYTQYQRTVHKLQPYLLLQISRSIYCCKTVVNAGELGSTISMMFTHKRSQKLIFSSPSTWAFILSWYHIKSISSRNIAYSTWVTMQCSQNQILANSFVCMHVHTLLHTYSELLHWIYYQLKYLVQWQTLRISSYPLCDCSLILQLYLHTLYLQLCSTIWTRITTPANNCKYYSTCSISFRSRNSCVLFGLAGPTILLGPDNPS